LEMGGIALVLFASQWRQIHLQISYRRWGPQSSYGEQSVTFDKLEALRRDLDLLK